MPLDVSVLFTEPFPFMMAAPPHFDMLVFVPQTRLVYFTTKKGNSAKVSAALFFFPAIFSALVLLASDQMPLTMGKCSGVFFLPSVISFFHRRFQSKDKFKTIAVICFTCPSSGLKHSCNFSGIINTPSSVSLTSPFALGPFPQFLVVLPLP